VGKYVTADALERWVNQREDKVSMELKRHTFGRCWTELAQVCDKKADFANIVSDKPSVYVTVGYLLQNTDTKKMLP
jgi:hypothetical protein